MRKTTTTKQISTALSNNLLTIEKAECHYKSSSRIDEISAEKFKNDFDFLCEAGVFAESLGWHYEKDIKTSGYIIETGRHNPNSEIIITVYMKACENASDEDIDKALLFLEE